MSTSEAQDRAAVRIEPCLNQKEQEFIARRKNTVLQNLQKLQIQCTQDSMPNIALMGSGGGERAMLALLGSLVQLGEAGLLDCALYLSGVSGSTWCMASLYQEPDWSSKLGMVKEKIVKRLGGPAVSWGDTLEKLKKYYYGKNNFSLTDVWAVLIVASYVKEIDEHTLSELWNDLSKDPYPIYTVIDKACKHKEEEGDPWVEITPHESGYSLTGAFVDTCDFGSQFHEGSKKNPQDEFDMLYLQALCGSALGDMDEIKAALWQMIKDFFQNSFQKMKAGWWRKGKNTEEGMIETQTLHESFNPEDEECYLEFMKFVDKNIAMLNADPSEIEVQSLIGEKLSDTWNKLRDKAKNKAWPYDAWTSICKQMMHWIWGTNYNFLHNVNDQAVPSPLLETETRDFIDAGLLNNSPYFAVLRKDRNIDLIISLDFSQGDPFMTVREAANSCKKLNIPFPEVHIPQEDLKKPKDFYVFKGENVPTVIHIPLFNVINCGDKIEDMRKKYSTFKLHYTAEMITELVEVAGKNIINNREKLTEEIRAAVESKRKQE